jgi:DNA-directed RNA polymerase specialized sigma24 family protein
MDDDEYPISSLADAAAGGDEQAWQEIVDRFAPLLASVIGSFPLTDAERRDVAGVVWLRLADHLAGLREPEAVPAWIITTCLREAQSSLSDRKAPAPRDPRDPSRADRHALLLAGLAELPSAQRELVLLLLADRPLPDAEISERTGIAVADIAAARARALERIRRTAARVVSEHNSSVRIRSAFHGLAARGAAGPWRN